MPEVTYTYSEKEMDAVRDLLMRMDVELGSLTVNIDDPVKAIERAKVLNKLKRELQLKLSIEL